MPEEQVKPLVMWADYVFGRVINMGIPKINQKGQRIRRMIVAVQDNVLDDYRIDINEEGVHNDWVKGGRYLVREYLEVYVDIRLKPARAGGRNEVIMHIRCGFDGNVIEEDSINTKHARYILMLESEINGLYGQLALYSQELTSARSQLFEYYQQLKNMESIKPKEADKKLGDDIET